MLGAGSFPLPQEEVIRVWLWKERGGKSSWGRVHAGERDSDGEVLERRNFQDS